MNPIQSPATVQLEPSSQSVACCVRWGRWAAALLVLGLIGLPIASLVGCNLVDDRQGEQDSGDQTTASRAPADLVTDAPLDDDAAPDRGDAMTGAVVEDVHWQESFAAALTEAAKQDRPVLLRLTAVWCGPCQVMDASVWPDERVKAALADRVVPVKIDIDHDTEVARRYGVRTIPTLLLVNSDGDEIDRGGFMSAEGLVQFLSSH